MDETESRAARLETLKQAKRLLEEEQKEDSDKPVLRFRNYELRDETIEHVKLPQAQPTALDEPTVDSSHTADPLADDVLDVAPKRLNHDLKRDVEQQLQLLEKRTQRALIQLQQEEERKRLEQDGGIADTEGSPSDDRSSENSP